MNPQTTAQRRPIRRLAQPFAMSSSVVRASAKSLKRSVTASFDARPSQAHYDILKMGVSIWNRWRLDDPQIIPNLQNADLSGLELENVNFSGANLRGARLDHSLLYDADFQRADLRGASFVRSLLVGASLHKANLTDANLQHAYLNQSDLSNANLTGACLQEADLQSALLTEAALANAHLAKAEMTASQDLTVRQLRSAKDGHLAFLADGLSESLKELSPLTVAPQRSFALPAATDTAPADKVAQTPARESARESAREATREKASKFTPVHLSNATATIEISFQPHQVAV